MTLLGASKVLSASGPYELFQSALGARASRRRLVQDFIRPRPGDRILDAGCGPADVLDALPTDVSYVGFDASDGYIRDATTRWGSRGRFFAADAGDALPADLLGQFDTVLGIGLLHHLDDSEVGRFCEQVPGWLDGSGTFVTLDAVFHPGQHPIARWLARNDRGEHVRTPARYLELVTPHFDDVESWLLTSPLRVPYSQFIMRATTAAP
jgi:SAM-dependent methyltransferase